MQEKQLHFTANGKVSQSLESGFIYLFIFKDEAAFLREQLATTQHFHNKIYVASC